MVSNLQDKEILITGANGLIGFEVLKELVNSNLPYPIKAFVRKMPSLKLQNVDYIISDLENGPPKDLFKGKKVLLLHFANRNKANSLDEYRKTNVVGIQKILDQYGSQIELIIHASSMSVYGQGPFYGIEETHSLNPETELAVSRKEAEEVILNFCQEKNISHIIFRTRFIFGEKDKETLPALIKLIKKRVVIGSGEQKFSFISNIDYAKVVAYFIKEDSKINGIFNLSYKNPVSFNTIYELISDHNPKIKIPANLIIKYCGYFKLLKKIRTKMQLIGQDQVLSTTKIENAYPMLKEIDSRLILKEIIQSKKRINEL